MKRKSISKAIRQQVYEKYGRRCAYCGCKLTMAEMQVDHVAAVYTHEGGAGLDNEDNLMPACRACNFYKSTFGIEDFRKRIETIPERLEESFIYRLAKKYGLVTRGEKYVEFWFEKCNRGLSLEENIRQLNEDGLTCWYGEPRGESKKEKGYE